MAHVSPQSVHSLVCVIALADSRSGQPLFATFQPVHIVAAMMGRASVLVALSLALASTTAEATLIGRLRQMYRLSSPAAPSPVRFPDSFEVGGQTDNFCSDSCVVAQPTATRATWQVAYTYSLPYVESYQAGGLR